MGSKYIDKHDGIPFKGYVWPAILFLLAYFYTLNSWGVPWRLSFLIGVGGWFLGITSQTAFFGTW